MLPRWLGTSAAWGRDHRELGPRTLRRGHCPAASGASGERPCRMGFRALSRAATQLVLPCGQLVKHCSTLSKGRKFLQSMPWSLGLVRVGLNQDVTSWYKRGKDFGRRHEGDECEPVQGVYFHVCLILYVQHFSLHGFIYFIMKEMCVRVWQRQKDTERGKEGIRLSQWMQASGGPKVVVSAGVHSRLRAVLFPHSPPDRSNPLSFWLWVQGCLKPTSRPPQSADSSTSLLSQSKVGWEPTC